MQYVPGKALYVYFRYDARQTILCAMNTGMKPADIDFSHYSQRTAGFTEGVDVVTGLHYPLGQKAQSPGGRCGCWNSPIKGTPRGASQQHILHIQTADLTPIFHEFHDRLL
jgi:hypothetical protein